MSQGHSQQGLQEYSSFLRDIILSLAKMLRSIFNPKYEGLLSNA